MKGIGGGGLSQAYVTIQDESVSLTQRSTINFAGAGVTASDDGPDAVTLVTIPGGGGGSGTDGALDPTGAGGYGYQLPGVNITSLNQGMIPVVNKLYCAPFALNTARTLTALAILVNSAGTAGSLMRVGVYSADSAFVPNGVVIDAGTVAIDSTGVKKISGLSQALPAGRYLFAWIHNAAAAPTLGVAFTTSPFIGVRNNLQQTGTEYSVAQAFGPLPANPVPVLSGGFSAFAGYAVFGLFT